MTAESLIRAASRHLATRVHVKDLIEFACGYCGASTGDPCKTSSGKALTRANFHQSRWDARSRLACYKHDELARRKMIAFQADLAENVDCMEDVHHFLKKWLTVKVVRRIITCPEEGVAWGVFVKVFLGPGEDPLIEVKV